MKRLFIGLCCGLLPISSAVASELGDILSSSLTHPGIKARQLDVQAAQQGLSAETARYYGSGQALAETSRFEGQRIVGVFVPDTSGTLPPLDRDVSRYGLSYRLPVDVFGVIRAARERARHDLQAARLLERQTTLLKLHQVTSAYVRMQALTRQQQGLTKRSETLDKTLERVKAEVELGKAAKVDLRLADSELARVEADSIRLVGALNQTQAALVEASGHAAAPTAQTIFLPAWQQADSATSIPVRLSQERATAAQARAREVEKALWPSLSAGGDYFEFDGGGETPDAWSVTLGVSVPLDATAWRRKSAAAYQAEAAVADQQAAKRQTQQQLAALKAAYDSAVADAAALRTELVYRRDVVELETEKHRLGAQTLENLLRHERDWLDTVFRLADAEAQAATAWSATQVLMGISTDDYIKALGEGG